MDAEGCVAAVLQLEVQITCTCAIWGMQTSVESMMIAQAEESMAKFLAWAEKHCYAVKQVMLLHASALVIEALLTAACMKKIDMQAPVLD